MTAKFGSNTGPRFGARKLLNGVGVNDADYVVVKAGFRCPFYATWSNMIKRAYCEKFHKAQPTYAGCLVSDEWLTFSNFKLWMSAQNWEGCQLDKDLISPGSKIYSAETCAFVPSWVNMLFAGKLKGSLPIGVKKVRGDRVKPYQARLGETYLGYFVSPVEAHRAWQLAKADYLKEAAKRYSSELNFDTRIFNAIISREKKLREEFALGLETSKESFWLN